MNNTIQYNTIQYNNYFISNNKFDIQILNSSHLINKASQLLYDVYIKELKWDFAKNNPSNLHIINNQLKDRFTESAVWFGAFDKQELIACIRLVGVDANNKFEFESYQNSKVIHHLLPNKQNSVEVTRLAILPKYRKSGLLKQVWLNVFTYCLKNNYSLLALTANPTLKNLFNKIGFTLKAKDAFKYEESDAFHVNFYLSTPHEINHMLLQLGTNL